MSIPVDAPWVPAISDLPPSERDVYNHICAAGHKGMWSQDLRYATKLSAPILSKLTGALVQRGILKEVTDVRHRGKKVLMDARFEPAPEIAGHHNGRLDTDVVVLGSVLAGTTLY